MPSPADGEGLRILLVRTSALGDVVHALPTLIALRRHLPKAVIGWVVEASNAPVLAGHPDLDRVFQVRLKTWRKRALSRDHRRAWRGLKNDLRAFRPDVALDLMGNFKGGALARLCGAPRRIGLAPAFRKEPTSRFLLNEHVTPAGPHAVDHALAPLSGLGIAVDSASVDFGPEKIFRQSKGSADPLLAAADLTDEPFFLLHPGAGWVSKEYPPERWAATVRGLHERTGVATLLSAGPGEQDLAAEIACRGGEMVRRSPMADLPALADLIRRCRLMLGGDTGPLHLGHALGAPVLLLHGPTDPVRHGPYGAPRRAIAHRPPGGYRYKRLAGAEQELHSIAPEEVIERALELLAEASPTGPKPS
ncbi:MAG: glycosyltransferase family 9 protein [Acidobacteriota bacterium]